MASSLSILACFIQVYTSFTAIFTAIAIFTELLKDHSRLGFLHAVTGRAGYMWLKSLHGQYQNQSKVVRSLNTHFIKTYKFTNGELLSQSLLGYALNKNAFEN